MSALPATLRLPGVIASMMCLAGGAAASWAVAWSFAAWSEPYKSEWVSESAVWWGPASAIRGEPHDAGEQRVELTWFSIPGCTVWILARERFQNDWWADDMQLHPKPFEDVAPSWGRFDHINWIEVARDRDGEIERWESEFRSLYAWGWPWRCLWSEAIWDQSQNRTTCEGGLDVSLSPYSHTAFGSHPRLLPLRPIWRGLIGNTLLYAPLLWLTLWLIAYQLPHSIRRRYRRRNRLCPACGYNIRGLARPAATCPECGSTTPPTLDPSRTATTQRR